MNEALKARLIELGLSAEQVTKLAGEGVKEEADLQLLNRDELKSLTGCGLVVAAKVAAAFTAPVVVTPAESAVPPMGAATFDILPPVPSDEAWMNALKVGGVLKFNSSTVIGTVSAALAAKVGLYELPSKIGSAMERQAESLEEPVGEDYYQMQNLLTRRSYADIFAAMPGVDGRFATQTRKDALLRRLNERLWGSLSSYQQQLKQWVEAWQQGMSNPAAMMSVFTAMAGGVGAVPPGMMQPPPIDVLRDAADGVVNDINYVFAGTGIPVAMALAYDAQQIRKVLENPSLPAQVGAANREQMLRMLGAAVSSDYPRLEKNLKQFALGIIEFQNVTSGQAELQYVVALYQLGSMIPWDKLDTGDGGHSGLGRGGKKL